MKLRYVIPAVVIGLAIPVAGFAYAQTGPGQKLDCEVLTSEGPRLTLDCVEQTEVPTSTTSAPTSTSSTTTTEPATSSTSTTSTVPATTAAPTTTQAPTTTAAPATTTTVPASTTTSPPSSTTSSTTSTLPPTTTAPPAGVAFSEDFSSSASVDRFYLDVGDYVTANGQDVASLIDCCPWIDTPQFTYGDHSMACGAPATAPTGHDETTHRTLNNETGPWTQYFWYCAPGSDPSKGHFMTGFDSTGYTVVSFSPKQVFQTVTKVCWDVNATDEGGGKWTNMILVPDATFQSNKRPKGSRLDNDRAAQAPYRMDYVRFDFNSPNAPGDFNLQVGDYPGTISGVTDFRGTQFVYHGSTLDAHPGGDTAHVTADRAARYQHCVEKLDANTARLTIQRPPDASHPQVWVETYNVPFVWPTGPTHVIFQDEMYDPPKRANYDESHITWHWDNVQVTAG